MLPKAKNWLKLYLESKGWYVERLAGCAIGTNLFYDLQSRLEFGPASIVFDIGAHQGESAIVYAKRFPNAKIFSFEPVQETFKQLTNNIRLSKLAQVECVRSALGDRVEVAKIVLQGDTQLNSLCFRASDMESKGVEDVPVITVDRFVAERGIKRIDFMKIDTEGQEMAVLKGARNTLSAGNIRALFLEATLEPSDRLHTNLIEIRDYLFPLGFMLIALYDQHIFPHPTRLGFLNVLFAK
jgi:FkbM family methyltransferase